MTDAQNKPQGQNKPESLAQLRYLDGGFETIVPGTHVICAVTQRPIPLDMLRYWSVARQEAYFDAAASLQAHLQADK